jgi:colanic acid biosynthesis protein WcaH
MELGRAIPRGEASLLGLYEHHYEDNALEISGVSTHYVVAAYQLNVDTASLGVLPDEQHEQYRWMDVNEIREDPDVHPNTKAYFSLQS